MKTINKPKRNGKKEDMKPKRSNYFFNKSRDTMIIKKQLKRGNQ